MVLYHLLPMCGVVSFEPPQPYHWLAVFKAMKASVAHSTVLCGGIKRYHIRGSVSSVRASTENTVFIFQPEDVLFGFHGVQYSNCLVIHGFWRSILEQRRFSIRPLGNGEDGNTRWHFLWTY